MCRQVSLRSYSKLSYAKSFVFNTQNYLQTSGILEAPRQKNGKELINTIKNIATGFKLVPQGEKNGSICLENVISK